MSAEVTAGLTATTALKKEFKKLRPVLRGRPKSAVHKIPVKVRLDPHVVEFFRASGRGWQTRMNDTLAAHMKRLKGRQAQRPDARG